MSSKECQKEVVDSLWESARLVSYTIVPALRAIKELGVSKPSANMDLANGMKLTGYVTGEISFGDYAIKQG